MRQRAHGRVMISTVSAHPLNVAALVERFSATTKALYPQHVRTTSGSSPLPNVALAVALGHHIHHITGPILDPILDPSWTRSTTDGIARSRANNRTVQSRVIADQMALATFSTVSVRS